MAVADGERPGPELVSNVYTSGDDGTHKVQHETGGHFNAGYGKTRTHG